MLTWVDLLEASLSVRRGEGGGVGKGKKDTGYLYKAFMVARRALFPCPLLVKRWSFDCMRVYCMERATWHD